MTVKEEGGYQYMNKRDNWEKDKETKLFSQDAG